VAHEIDFNEAEQLGWEIAPRFEARKGDRVLRGTAAELTPLIAEHEQREAMLDEQRQHAHREHHDVSISKLVRHLYRLGEEHVRAWDRYLDESRHHHTRMQALDRATTHVERMTETFEELFGHSKEVLLENDEFRELQEAIRRSDASS
jgi:hypothetical protein